MEKCCRTCRNYKDGRCYSRAFENDEIELPEVYVTIDPDDLNDSLKEEDIDIDYEDIVTIANTARYVSTYEYEDVKEKQKGVAIADSSIFYCCDYR